MEPNTARTLLTVEAAAEALSISRSNMYKLIGSGAVHSLRVGQLRRVPTEAIAAYVQRLTAEQHPATEHAT